MFQRSSKSPRKGVPGKSTSNTPPPVNKRRPRRFSLIYSSDSSLSDISDKEASDISEEDENDDDDDDDDDTSSSSDDEDENIDFVKLSAQRKKRAMQALSAFKNQHNKADTTSIEEEDVGEEVIDTDEGDEDNDKDNINAKNKDNTVDIDNDIPVPQFKSEDEDNGEADNNSDENEKDDEEEISIGNDDFNAEGIVGSDGESDYDIDQDAYFDAIEKENDSDVDIETGNEEDLPTILHEEELNIMNEYTNSNNDTSNWDAESSLSSFDMFDGFGNDADEEEEELEGDSSKQYITNKKSTDDLDLNDIDLSVEKPTTRQLSKNTVSNGKKNPISRVKKPVRKLLKKKHSHSLKDALDSDDYIFNVFFQSDESADDKDGSQNIVSDSESLQLSKFFAGKSDKIDDTDDTSKNILLDVANLPSEDDNLPSDKELSGSDLIDSDEEDSFSDLDGISVSSIDLDEEDEDDLRLSNVFVDIDDLDPDSFYFHYDDENDSTGSLDIDNVKLYLNKDDDSKNDIVETVVYADDESTDEDDNLPPPEARNKSIGTKAKEVVSANVVGLKPPKLGTWNTNNKPFSIIDGMSTKSLHALIQEHQQLKEQKMSGLEPTKQDPPSSPVSNGDELTLNELLNMSELEDDEGMTSSNALSNINSTDRNGNSLHCVKNNAYNSLSITDWYEKPKVPLSAFRNKGISVFQEDEYMVPTTHIKKVPIGYMGMEKTRRKFDKMKEIQKKRNEKKRRLKKKKKMLKIKKEQARLLKENEMEQMLPTPLNFPTERDIHLPTIE